MSFEKIQLPDFLIADLYKDCIVELETVKEKQLNSREEAAQPIESPRVETQKALKYLGQNKRNVSVIVNTPEAAIISDADLAFLTTILKACGFNLGDIAIINNHSQPVQFTELKEQIAAEKILLFDVDPLSINLPFSIPHFQVQPFNDCTIISAPSLAVLNQQTEEGRLLKTKLWVSLKKLFDIA